MEIVQTGSHRLTTPLPTTLDPENSAQLKGFSLTVATTTSEADPRDCCGNVLQDRDCVCVCVVDVRPDTDEDSGMINTLTEVFGFGLVLSSILILTTCPDLLPAGSQLGSVFPP